MKKNLDIIVVAGQSNAEGSGLGEVMVPYVENDRILQMNQDFTICIAHERRNEEQELVGRFQLAFAQKYLEECLLENRDILLIEAAVGATGFIPAENHGTWCRGDKLSNRMFAMVEEALALNSENRVVEFLWHQGERQINFNMDPLLHEQYMVELLDDVVEKIGDVPVILGDFVPQWKDTKGIDAINISNKSEQIAYRYGGYFVKTEGLLSNSQVLPDTHSHAADMIHFSRVALYELGIRYFQAYKKSIVKS